MNNVVYHEAVTGLRSPRIAYRQSLWLANMWHTLLGCGLGA